MPSIYWGIIWVSLVIGWYLLYHFRLKLIVRRGYLATVTILALVVLWHLPGFAKKQGHFRQVLSICLVSLMDGNS